MGSPQISPTIHHSPRSGCASAVVMRLVEEEDGHWPLTIAGADANNSCWRRTRAEINHPARDDYSWAAVRPEWHTGSPGASGPAYRWRSRALEQKHKATLSLSAVESRCGRWTLNAER